MTMPQYSSRTQSGFTLMEVLIVLGVFAVISTICYTAISQYIEIDEKLDARSKVLQRLDRLFLLLDRDIRYAAPRSVTNSIGEPESAFIVSYSNGLPGEVIRVTTSYPGYDDSKLELLYRVAWQFDDGGMYRHVWTVLDHAKAQEPSPSLIIDGVADFSIEEFHWSEDFGLQSGRRQFQGASSVLPAGVRISLLMDDGKEYERVIDIADGAS